MSSKNFNIKSSTIEKGLELAKDFLGRLINPAAEEVGLLPGHSKPLYTINEKLTIMNQITKFVVLNKRNNFVITLNLILCKFL